FQRTNYFKTVNNLYNHPVKFRLYSTDNKATWTFSEFTPNASLLFEAEPFNPTVVSSHFHKSGLHLPETERISSSVMTGAGSRLFGALNRTFYDLVDIVPGDSRGNIAYSHDFRAVMPIPLSSPCLVADTQYVYVLGGLYGHQSSVVTMRYDFENQKWGFGNPMNYGHEGGGCVLVLGSSHIIAFGGRHGYGSSPSLRKLRGEIEFTSALSVEKLANGEERWDPLWAEYHTLLEPWVYDFQSIYIEVFSGGDGGEPIQLIFMAGGKYENGEKSKRTQF
ncbi:MAG: hypothetical protein GY940_31150, partial [bacterium]|nr:hypothetical protein [bacterium]